MAFVKIVNQDKLNIVSSAVNIADNIGAYATRGMSADASLDKAFDDIRGAWGGGVGHWAQGEADKKAGVPLVTEEFANNIQQKYGVSLPPDARGETEGQYLFRLDRLLQDGVNQARISKEFPVTNFISALPGQVQEPSNYFPVSLALRTASAPLKALRSSKNINKTAAAINRGQRFKAALYGGKDLLRDNLVFNTLVQPLYEADRRRMGQETGLLESIYEVGMSSVIGTGLFLPLITGLNVRAANINLKNAQTFQEIHSFMNTGQFEKAASVAYSNSPQFRNAIKRADEFSDFVQDAIDTDGLLRLTDLDPQQLETLKGMLNTHMEQSLQSAVTNGVTQEILKNAKEDSNLPIPEKSAKYKKMFTNVYTAIKRRNVEGLTPTEKALVDDIVKNSEDLHTYKNEAGDEVIGSAFDVDAQIKADTFAEFIYDLYRKHKTNSMQDLVDKGILTAKQRVTLLRKFNKVYKRGYAKEIAIANRVIDEVFGGRFTFKRAEDTSEMAFGFYKAKEGATRAERETLYLNRMDFIVGANQSPFSILFHEAMHALQLRDPDSYNQIEAIILKHPKLKKQLDAMAEERGYYFTQVPYERVPALIEWALTTPEFWAELSKNNKTLFSKLKLALQKMVADIQVKYFEGTRSYFISDDILPTLLEPGTTPAQLATRLGELINNSRNQLGNKSWLGNTKERHRANMRRLLATERDELPTSTDDFINKHNPKNYRELVKDARQEGLADDLQGLVPSEVFQKGGALEFIASFFVNRDKSNLDVDPDATELISYGEFAATVREKIGVFEEDGTIGDVFTDIEYGRLYSIIRDWYRDETSGKISDRDLRNFIDEQQEYQDIPWEYIEGEIKAFYFYKFVSEIRDILKRRKISALMKEELGGAASVTDQLRWLRSFLDGRDRSARTGRSGLEHHMIADGQQTVVPLMDVLLRHNLVEIFLPEQGMAFFRAFRNRSSSKTWKLFGKNRKAQSKEFFRQLHQGLIKRELPDNWQGIEALEELFNVLQATEVKTISDLNKAGLNVSMLKDFGGITQKWDSDIIYNMGYRKFYELMDRYMDKEETARRMYNELADGETYVEWTFDRFMKQWYESLDPNKKTGDDVQLFDLDAVFGSRNVAIKPEFATDAALQFSGYDSIGHLMIAQMQRRGALAALTEIAGTKPSETLKGLVDDLVRDDTVQKKVKDEIVSDKVKVKQSVESNEESFRTKYSQVIETGKPVSITAYRGISEATFEGNVNLSGTEGRSWANNIEQASYYSNNVVKATLNLKKPFVIRTEKDITKFVSGVLKKKFKSQDEAEVAAIMELRRNNQLTFEWAKSQGYDSIVIDLETPSAMFDQNEIVIFESIARTKDAKIGRIKKISKKNTDKFLYLKTVDKITGLLDNPVDATIGAYTNRAMRYSNVVFLSGSGITSLTDIPNAIATLDVMGIPTRQHLGDFLTAYKEGTARRFTRDKKGMKSYFLKLSATFDVLNNSVAQRITDLSPEKGSTFEAKLNQLMFKLNGLNALTTTSEEMFVDVLTRFIAEALQDPNGVMTQNLTQFGFTKAEIKQLTKQTKTPDGVDRLDIDALSPAARKKFDRFVTKYIRQGVFRPDIGTQITTVFGTRAGTPIGSAARLLTQYSSFMLGMSQNIFYRMKNGITDTRAVDDVMLYKMSHFISFTAGSLAFAYISTVLKDLAKGKEPINLVDMNSREWSRVVQQSGLLGILEIPLDMYDFGVTEAAAPLPSTLFGLAAEIGTADLTGAYKKVQDLTGENVYGPPQWFHTYVGHYMLEYLNEIEQWMLDDTQK